MSVKNTSIGQVLKYGALALIGHQAYRYYNSKVKTKQDLNHVNNKLDTMLDDSFPASDPLPLSRSGTNI